MKLHWNKKLPHSKGNKSHNEDTTYSLGVLAGHILTKRLILKINKELKQPHRKKIVWWKTGQDSIKMANRYMKNAQLL
jgi:hypothetical protein